MRSIADFVVFDRRGQIVALAEAKKKLGTSQTWATQWARNFLAHTQAPAYLLLVTPDRLYLWNDPASQRSAELVPHVANAREIFQRYLQSTDRSSLDLSSGAFELVVAAWLDDVLRRLWQPDKSDQREVLVDSGFIDAVRDGRIKADDAA